MYVTVRGCASRVVSNDHCLLWGHYLGRCVRGGFAERRGGGGREVGTFFSLSCVDIMWR